MNKEVEEYDYSDDATLKKAIGLIKKGSTEKDVREKFNLSDDDMELIDFVINEF
ncbi:hypothetical protein [Alkalihalobacillus sp. 1P02AB]|uniref:hypothetical protein n=1 Tax=Alkalihalobacillus sp. 1P02AB TaxID=3132260 RepID=UPI0039A499E4